MSVFGHGQLRLYLLGLLEQGPRHGYEVIRDLEERFSGLYSPSAGTVYPRLAKLEEEGLVERTEDGRKTSYRLTDAGRQEARSRAGEIADLESSLDDSAAQMAEEARRRVREGADDLRNEIDAETSGLGTDENGRGQGGLPFDVDGLLAGFSREVFSDTEKMTDAVRRMFASGNPFAPGRTDSEHEAHDVVREAEEAVRQAEREAGRTDGGADRTPREADTVELANRTGRFGDAEVAEEDVVDGEVFEGETPPEGSRQDGGRQDPFTGMPNADQIREVVAILQDAGTRIQDVLRRR